MRTESWLVRLWLCALLCCGAANARDESADTALPAWTVLLLDGLDAELLDAVDGNAELLAPELARFCSEALAHSDAHSALTHGELGVAAFFASAGDAPDVLAAIGAGTATLSELQIVPSESLATALSRAPARLLVHLREDPLRPLDAELLLRTDPTPWAGAERAVDHREQRENRLQRGQLLFRLRAENRPALQTPDLQDQDWLARYRLAELERQIAPALAALRGASAKRAVLLSALHGPRAHAGDLSPRARRVPYYVWPSSAPHRTAPGTLPSASRPAASWSFSASAGDAAFGFARWTERICLRAERGRLQLFDRRFDSGESVDLAASQPQLLARTQAEAAAELLGNEPILQLRARSPRALRLRLPAIASASVLHVEAAHALEQAGALVIDLPAGDSSLTLRLRGDAEPLRIQGDLRECRLVLGTTAWTAGAQLRLDLASGALLAALGGEASSTNDASRQPELRIWIERR